VIDQIKPPLTVSLTKAHEFLGAGSRTQFKKTWVDSGLVKPVDMGGRGLSIIVAELEEAVRKRAEMIRSGELVPPIRSSRGKKAAAEKTRAAAL
jgi:hypothetical protein